MVKYLQGDSGMKKVNRLRCVFIGLVGISCSSAWGEEWGKHGGGHAEKRYSILSAINEKNVTNLGVDWFFDLPGAQDGLAATPIVSDGVIYITTSFSNVYAVDSKTGRQIWHFNPGVKAKHGFSNSWAARVNRGVAVEGNKVIVATADCRLIAVEKDTGKAMWDVLTCDPSLEYSITGAPRVANGKVFIGNGISDFGARGYLSSYDLETGKMVWRFWTVPGDPKRGHENETMKMASKTWADGYAKNGGGSPWDAIVYDEKYNQVIFGTDSGIPYDPDVRSPGGGDNLFLNSIVAVDANTGRYKWHYQTVPNDAWDFNSANHIIQAELNIDGKQKDVLMQAPKNGFFYVIDRSNGRLLKADPYVNATWASRIDLKSGRPIENPAARYHKTKEGRSRVTPSLLGGHNWHPMSYSDKTGLVYIPAHEFSTTYRLNPDSQLGGALFDWYGNDLNAERDDLSKSATQIGRLIAWDPRRGKAAWTVDHELPMNGGVLSTAGNLVFQGTATGKLNALSADKGQLLWSFDLGSAVQAPPVTYMRDGVQYVLIPAGSGGIGRFMVPLYGTGKSAVGPDRLIAFSLNGRKELPKDVESDEIVPRPPFETEDKKLVEKGRELFEENACGICHGSVAVGRRPVGSSVRDLRYMDAETHKNFYKIVLDGLYKALGMMPHKDILSLDQARAIHYFIVDSQWKLYNEKNK